MSFHNGKTAQAIEMVQKGLPQAIVAARLGIRKGTLSNYIRRARKQGIEIPSRGHGRAVSIIAALPQEVGHWLTDQVPEGAKVEEVIKAIVLDAYYEETQK
jgi:transposase